MFGYTVTVSEAGKLRETLQEELLKQNISKSQIQPVQLPYLFFKCCVFCLFSYLFVEQTEFFNGIVVYIIKISHLSVDCNINISL